MNRNFPANTLWHYQLKKSNGRWTRCRIPKRKLNCEPSGATPPWAARSLGHILRLLSLLSAEK